jgi:uncharacterized protein YjbI with pentapeptide repeats
MRWSKREIWKTGVIIVCMLLLLLLMVLFPMKVTGAYIVTPGLAIPATIAEQATPTEDATVTELNKEKLAQEVQQLKNQNSPDPLDWLRINAPILLSTLVVVIGGLIGLFRWFSDRRDEREKRAEERFQSAVTGLGDDKEGTRIGATILLHTFLRPGYEQFYAQTFELAVANLRFLRTPGPQENSNLSQALVAVFKEAFPLARSQNKGEPQSLDASFIKLDNAYLSRGDLKQVWMPRASLRKAHLHKSDLSGAVLWGAKLNNADLREAKLNGIGLKGADLSGALLGRADLSGARLWGANLEDADLRGADLSGARLWGANLEDALTLKETELRGAKGLTKEQLKVCKVKGAIIDEYPTVSSSQ